MSGHVGGHVVQAGAVHGDVVLDTATQARIEHARALRDERLAAYAAFLETAVPLTKLVYQVAHVADEMMRRRCATADELARLERQRHEVKRSLDALQPHLHLVQTMGPVGAYESARSISVCTLAVWLSCDLADQRDKPLRKWQKHHDQFCERLAQSMSDFRNEVRQVREEPIA